MAAPRSTAEHVVILVACADEAQAARVARAVVEARVAACAQALPIRSVYRWEGAVVEDHEALLLIKTRAERFEAVAAVVRDLHDYDVPEIVALPVVAGSRDYLDWVDAETRPD